MFVCSTQFKEREMDLEGIHCITENICLSLLIPLYLHYLHTYWLTN